MEMTVENLKTFVESRSLPLGRGLLRKSTQSTLNLLHLLLLLRSSV